MKTMKEGTVQKQLSTLFNIGATRELTDGQLLERFSTGPTEVAELAFEALIERHGPMVLHICRAQVTDPHDTQDAFQATFLILIRKARALWIRESLGPWLHQVAVRTASCARSNAARRRKHEGRAAELAANRIGYERESSFELERVLHAEINRLPECYRIPIVLCDLEAHTCEEAAQRMGCPVGTVKSWRFRGRQHLRDRLIRLGLAPSAIAGAVVLAKNANAAVFQEIARNAMRALSKWMAAGEVPLSVHKLVKGVLNTMIIGKLRTTAAVCFGLVLFTAGSGEVAWALADDTTGSRNEVRLAAAPECSRRRPSSRRSEAQGKSRGLETISPGSNPDRSGFRGRRSRHLAWAERSCRQDRTGCGQHGSRTVQVRGHGTHSLGRTAVLEPRPGPRQRPASEHAVKLAEKVLDHEQAGLAVGQATLAEVSEAAQRLEQLNLDLVTRTSDVATTEQLLRNLLGLPWPDIRQIIPVTVPTEAQVEPDWNSSLAIMLEKQPDIVRSRALVKEAAADLSANGPARLDRCRESLQQVIRETTHSLARFFLEIDSNFKQFKTATRLRAKAALRLESQGAYYKEGRVTIDRYLDSVNHYATAVATEAQYKTTYNISIIALEEAKGTLLDYKQIAVVPNPKVPGPSAASRDGEIERTRYEPRTMSPTHSPAAPLGPSRPVPLATNPAPPTAVDPGPAPAGKTVKFQFTVGIGSNPIEIRGSFTITPARRTPSDALLSANCRIRTSRFECEESS